MTVYRSSNNAILSPHPPPAGRFRDPLAFPSLPAIAGCSRRRDPALWRSRLGSRRPPMAMRGPVVEVSRHGRGAGVIMPNGGGDMRATIAGSRPRSFRLGSLPAATPRSCAWPARPIAGPGRPRAILWRSLAGVGMIEVSRLDLAQMVERPVIRERRHRPGDPVRLPDSQSSLASKAAASIKSRRTSGLSIRSSVHIRRRKAISFGLGFSSTGDLINNSSMSSPSNY